MSDFERIIALGDSSGTRACIRHYEASRTIWVEMGQPPGTPVVVGFPTVEAARELARALLDVADRIDGGRGAAT